MPVGCDAECAGRFVAGPIAPQRTGVLRTFQRCRHFAEMALFAIDTGCGDDGRTCEPRVEGE